MHWLNPSLQQDARLASWTASCSVVVALIADSDEMVRITAVGQLVRPSLEPRPVSGTLHARESFWRCNA